MLVEINKDLLNLNTFKVKSVASKYIQIDSYDEILSSSFLKELQVPFNIIGSASNILFVSEYVGTIIRINTKGIEVDKHKDYILIKAQAGELLHDVVTFCVNNNYGGMENLALIPGSIGASPVQNVGAYGLEIKDILYNLEVLNTKTLKMEVFSANDCKFSYRKSVFKDNPNLYIICSITLKLPIDYKPKINYSSILERFDKLHIKEPSIKDIYDSICIIRSNKLPDVKTIGNAGSFFKNPMVTKNLLDRVLKFYPELSYTQYENNFKLSAAVLIELSGLKGIVKNKISVWQNQPLVIVNFGNPSGKDIFNFSDTIIECIYKKFGIILEREVNII